MSRNIAFLDIDPGQSVRLTTRSGARYTITASGRSWYFYRDNAQVPAHRDGVGYVDVQRTTECPVLLNGRLLIGDITSTKVVSSEVLDSDQAVRLAVSA